jgi:hypothetical protein
VTVANCGPDRKRAGDDAESYLVVALDIVQGPGADGGPRDGPDVNLSSMLRYAFIRWAMIQVEPDLRAFARAALVPAS